MADLAAAAFYLPQFHPTALNDSLWGEGFTEWRHVASARAQFSGHRQPRLPGSLGFYDLRSTRVQEAQAELAAAYGVQAFCYWYYWYEGRRELWQPTQRMLDSGRPDFPFCLGWANHHWTTGWAGSGSMVIPFEDSGASTYRRFFAHLLAFLRDDRYLRVGDRAVFHVYRPALLADPAAYVEVFRDQAAATGVGPLYLTAEIGSPEEGPPLLQVGLDAVVPSPMRFLRSCHQGRLDRRLLNSARRRMTDRGRSTPTALQRPARLPYSSIADTMCAWRPSLERSVGMVVPDFDNTPRHGRDGTIFIGSTPASFEDHATQVLKAFGEAAPLIYLKSWNEWAESNYLEPDAANGTAYLDAWSAARSSWSSQGLDGSAGNPSP